MALEAKMACGDDGGDDDDDVDGDGDDDGGDDDGDDYTDADDDDGDGDAHTNDTTITNRETSQEVTLGEPKDTCAGELGL